ncbi:MAG: endopeptidase La, partial [Spirochaetia bacterium]|nr:endopeptidase La [Spirochaetia bacterium]
EQNSTFRDTYLDIPFDVSEVLFICTANTLDTIPRPLLDRMEIIQLSGYTSEEKLAIGKKYLVPKSMEKHGLAKNEIKYSAAILRKIADEYAREAGVRNFEKSLHKINRKVALLLMENPQTDVPVVIDEKKLSEYLGEPIFAEDEIVKADRPGTAIGLAWTSMGGDTLIIEAQNTSGKGEVKLTGQLGEVMQESVSIAYTWIKAHALERKIEPSWFEQNAVHLHVPEGATPKDGPSAGITMTVALYSLITGQVMAQNMAMTGELTLKGKVMPIGGLKEKVLAARRNKIETILIPQYNKRDLDKLDDKVKEGITFHLVGTIEQVLSYAFPEDADRPQMEKLAPLSPNGKEEIAAISAAVAQAVREALREH